MFTLAFRVRVSHLIFNGGNRSAHGQGEDEARHGASPGPDPFSWLWVMISPLSSLHVSSCPALKRTAHHFHMFLSRASISLWMAPPFNRTKGIYHVNAGHGGVSVDGDVGRDNFVEQLWALLHPNQQTGTGWYRCRPKPPSELISAARKIQFESCK